MRALRITLLAGELRGARPAGGAATSNALLALALARLGHRVEIIVFGSHTSRDLDADWAAVYEDADVSVRFLPRERSIVKPWSFARPMEVDAMLRSVPPDVVIAQDAEAPAYCALRARDLGLGYADTVFVVFCHGTREWLKYANRNVRVFGNLLAETVLERASVELADAVVSPSAFLLRWMETRGWRLPERAFVIPYLTRSEARGELLPETHARAGQGVVARLAFFGRLNEIKGIGPFVEAVNALDPELLEPLELAFIGGELPLSVENVQARLAEDALRSLRRVVFETRLDQHAAIAELSRLGTLAVIPSLEDNSPNTVYECLEHGIPFIASDVGGIAELIAPEDRVRVLFQPTAEGIEQALRRVLANGQALEPVRPAFERGASLERWMEILALRPTARPVADLPSVGIVVLHHRSREALDRCLAALERQTMRDFDIAVTESDRQAGLAAVTGDWVCFLDEEDEPEPGFVETLARAQAASGADAVTCGLYLSDPDGRREPHLFPGEPHALGLLGNFYGTVALVARSRLQSPAVSEGEVDAEWPLLANLVAAGGRLVSVPVPLVTRRRRPGTLDDSPDALRVVRALERLLPRHAALLARLAGGLGAAARQASR